MYRITMWICWYTVNDAEIIVQDTRVYLTNCILTIADCVAIHNPQSTICNLQSRSLHANRSRLHHSPAGSGQRPL